MISACVAAAPSVSVYLPCLFFFLSPAPSILLVLEIAYKSYIYDMASLGSSRLHSISARTDMETSYAIDVEDLWGMMIQDKRLRQ